GHGHVLRQAAAGRRDRARVAGDRRLRPPRRSGATVQWPHHRSLPGQGLLDDARGRRQGGSRDVRRSRLRYPEGHRRHGRGAWRADPQAAHARAGGTPGRRQRQWRRGRAGGVPHHGRRHRSGLLSGRAAQVDSMPTRRCAPGTRVARGGRAGTPANRSRWLRARAVAILLAMALAIPQADARTVYRCVRDGTVSLATAPEPGSKCEARQLDDNAVQTPNLWGSMGVFSGTLYEREQDGTLVYSTRNLPGSRVYLRFTAVTPPGEPAHEGLGRVGTPRLAPFAA